MIRFKNRIKSERGGDHNRWGGVDIGRHGFEAAGASVTRLGTARLCSLDRCHARWAPCPEHGHKDQNRRKSLKPDHDAR
jgi:hypothetical protein